MIETDKSLIIKGCQVLIYLDNTTNMYEWKMSFLIFFLFRTLEEQAESSPHLARNRPVGYHDGKQWSMLGCQRTNLSKS